MYLHRGRASLYPTQPLSHEPQPPFPPRTAQDFYVIGDVDPEARVKLGVLANELICGTPDEDGLNNIKLEINGAKFAGNLSFADCLGAIFSRVLAIAIPLDDGRNGVTPERVSHFGTVFRRWAPLLRAFIFADETDELESFGGSTHTEP